ncbi:MAG: phosphate ABC transporter permease PstA [Fimbriimonadaceae bacterium]
MISESELLLRDRRRQGRSNTLASLAIGSAGVLVLIIVIIVGTVLWKGIPAMTWEFLSTGPQEGMSKGGIWPMIRGSILLMAGTLVLTLPIGVLAGIWLAEYATDNRLTRAIRASVSSLAGTPSIIFGLFGLAIFVLKFNLGTSLLAGWLTLAIYSIPMVVLTTEQAFKEVPQTVEEGGIALGLSKWQTTWKVMFPNALPGILTGLVLTVARVAGEAPPILLTAAIYYSTEKLSLGWDSLKRPVANLPYHLAEGYRQGGVIPEKIIWGTCLSLMLLVLIINLAATLIRARARAKLNW